MLPDNLFQAGQAGQPETQPAETSIGVGVPAVPEGEKYITLEEAKALIEESNKRQRQSLKDSVDARVKNEVERLRTAGIQATPEQVAQLMSEPEGRETPGQSQPTQPPDPQTPPAQAAQGSEPQDPVKAQAIAWMREDKANDQDPVLREIYRMQAEAGMRLMDDDPEVKKIEYGSLVTTLSSIQTALREKAERIGRIGSPARTPALAGGGTAAAPNWSSVPSGEIFEDHYKKKG
jgi:hypothetical protein